ncbi:MAG TPA: hypothetical protein VMJ93_13020 [Verrucomicrobiae bacterium]|nr:hypothetical protein [Verrucomicrobiae bacterium]
MDIAAGGIFSGDKSIEGMGEDITDHVVRIAKGEAIKKAQGLGRDDFISWKRGVFL